MMNVKLITTPTLYPMSLNDLKLQLRLDSGSVYGSGVLKTVKTCIDDTNWTGQQIARNYEELVKVIFN
jgi:hypothetical protein